MLDILLRFPSCSPPVEVLMEHLSRLIPRAYSVSSSPLESADSFSFAFNVITFSKNDGRRYSRNGVCTGWLYNLCKDMLNEGVTTFDDDLAKHLSTLSLNQGIVVDPNISKEIVVYRRKNHNFRLPEDLKSPIVMIGPGTGIAPFVGNEGTL